MSRKFRRLSSSDRALLGQAAVVQTLIGLGLVLLPFFLLRRLVSFSLRRVSGASKGRREAARIVWALQVSSRLVPVAATCLVQALAGLVLMTREGRASSVQVGISRSGDGRFKAHAWLVADGRCLLGGEEGLPEFQVLWTIDAPIRERACAA